MSDSGLELQQDGKSKGREEFILIVTTVGKPDEAEKLAGMLVKERKAACVSISSPVKSVYRWQGNVEVEAEIMLFIKTVKANYQKVEQLIRENHSYDVPEIIALPIVQGEVKYLQWLREQCS
ncbi:MAG: divalent-cation tolerance protein CutA [Candidatus Aminicenantes bacterium]|nr:divalent-cation tolerance protein CutA [Candidatus Aminicenantes bacterium]